jgi:hypothetical protein
MALKTNDLRPPERTKFSFLKLADAAKNLNSVSDELGKPIESLDAGLKKLNLGVTAWTPMEEGQDEFAPEYWWSRDIGYAKIGGKWGIALRTVSGDLRAPDHEKVEEWLFNDAPRWLRIMGIGHVPALIEKLIEETNKTAARIKERVTDALELAAAVGDMAAGAKK